MKFVDELPPLRRSYVSKYDAWFPVEDERALKRNKGRWALLREDVPKSDAAKFGQYLRNKHGLKVTQRVTTPGGSEYDVYAQYPGEAS